MNLNRLSGRTRKNSNHISLVTGSVTIGITITAFIIMMALLILWPFDNALGGVVSSVDAFKSSDNIIQNFSTSDTCIAILQRQMTH
jgi:hypothetical protein